MIVVEEEDDQGSSKLFKGQRLPFSSLYKEDKEKIKNNSDNCKCKNFANLFLCAQKLLKNTYMLKLVN